MFNTAPTITDIANVALGHLGEYRISDIDSTAPEAQKVSRMWGMTRDSLLQRYSWCFALHRETLVEVLPVPAFEWAHQFQLPTDFLAVYRFNGRGGGNGEQAWAVEGDRLLTNDATAQLRYVRRVESASSWPPLFALAFSYYLASAIAPAFTGSPGVSSSIAEKADDAIRQAIRASAIQMPTDVLA